VSHLKSLKSEDLWIFSINIQTLAWNYFQSKVKLLHLSVEYKKILYKKFFKKSFTNPPSSSIQALLQSLATLFSLAELPKKRFFFCVKESRIVKNRHKKEVVFVRLDTSKFITCWKEPLWLLELNTFWDDFLRVFFEKVRFFKNTSDPPKKLIQAFPNFFSQSGRRASILC